MLLTCGDALVDFLPKRILDGRSAYLPSPGGSCLNIAVAMGRLGAPSGFVGALSADFLGDSLARHAATSNVSLEFAPRVPFGSTLAFVSMDDGEPQYIFYDENTASRNWDCPPGSINFQMVSAIHFGSTTLVNEDVAQRTLALLNQAKRHSTISFDPNCRPFIVHEKATYRHTMDAFAKSADIVRMSDLDFDYLYEGETFAEKADALFSAGVTLFVITQGKGKVLAWHRSIGAMELAVTPVDAVDTVGAGDTFQGALLVALREMKRIERTALSTLRATDLLKALEFASTCASITCLRVGADPPRHDEVPPSYWHGLRS